MTLSAWIRPTATAEGWRRCSSARRTRTSCNASYAYGRSVGRAAAALSVGGVDTSAAPTAQSASTWTHVALTFDGTTLRLYVNGTQVGDRAGRRHRRVRPTRCGSAATSPTASSSTGLIDDVRVYNRALTAAEIQSDMNTAVGPSARRTRRRRPPPPALTATAVGASQINLEWTASTDNVGVTGYRVERCHGRRLHRTSPRSATPTGTTFNDTGLTRVDHLPLPGARRRRAGNLSALLDDRHRHHARGARHDAAVGADRADRDGGERDPDQPHVDGLDRQRRRHRLPGRALPGRGLHQLRADRHADRRPPSTTPASAGDDLPLPVRAADAAGNLSAYSAIASAPRRRARHDAADGPARADRDGRPRATQINLAWTASTDNVGVTGYRVERCQGAGCTDFAQVGTPTGTTFNNTGLSPATTYRYRVRAADAAGNLSAYSTIATATTPAPPTRRRRSAPTGPDRHGGERDPDQPRAGPRRPTTSASPATGSSAARAPAAPTFTQVGTPTGTTLQQHRPDARRPPTATRCAPSTRPATCSAYSTIATATTPAAPDTTPPSASVTAPAAGSVVSGNVTVSATATDNVGVAGVQFLLDGARLGAEDTTAPYSMTWNTTSASNGLHTLQARARDAAGNTGTSSSSVTVTVSNSAPPIPAGLVAGWSFNESLGTTVNDVSGNGNTRPCRTSHLDVGEVRRRPAVRRRQ